ncbi:unnamed protein product [Clavelina lepadiformis]|uniref:DAGKc domain-containing protein n=1 Tax=Clavelina lepadiformis TaxID=159417 RepID=A0ABP0FCD3_CLALP
MAVVAAKACNDNVQFVYNKFLCSLQIKHGALHVRCLKKLRLLVPRSPSSYHKEVPLCDIISVSTSRAEWNFNSTNDTLVTNNAYFNQSSSSPCYVLEVETVTKFRDKRWKIKTLKFQTSCEISCNDWCQYIKCKLQECLNKSSCQRPQNLLVFINPYGGRGKAKSVYKHEVAPLFEKVGIQTTVVLTQYRNHAREYVEKNDLDFFDGIVAVGGDGMLNEVINGLLVRTQKDNNIPLESCAINSGNASSSSYAKPTLRLGLIPAGSTNCISYVSQGNEDPATSALHIIVGDSHPLDLVSLHSDDGAFLRFSFSMTSYGYFGDVLDNSERLRKLGPSRYDFAGINAFVQLQAYPGEVHYLPSKVDHQSGQSKCRYPCSTCMDSIRKKQNYTPDKIESDAKQFTENNNATSFPTVQSASEVNDFSVHCDLSEIGFTVNKNPTGLEYEPVNIGMSAFPMITQNSFVEHISVPASDCEEWKVTRGNFIMVNSALMSCACAKCPYGLSPTAHLADGNVDLILVRQSSRANFFRYLLSHIGKGDRFDFPFVEVHRVRAFQYRAITKDEISLSDSSLEPITEEIPSLEKKTCKTSCWNTDGEIISKPNINVLVHRGLVNLFSRGIEE